MHWWPWELSASQERVFATPQDNTEECSSKQPQSTKMLYAKNSCKSRVEGYAKVFTDLCLQATYSRCHADHRNEGLTSGPTCTYNSQGKVSKSRMNTSESIQALAIVKKSTPND